MFFAAVGLLLLVLVLSQCLQQRFTGMQPAERFWNEIWDTQESQADQNDGSSAMAGETTGIVAGAIAGEMSGVAAGAIADEVSGAVADVATNETAAGILDTAASEKDVLTDPLGLTAASAGEIELAEISADGRILLYLSSSDAQMSAALLDQALFSLGWQSVGTQQEGPLSYFHVDGGQVVASAFIFLQNNAEGCSAVVQLV
jgi:hypothetical protein